MGNTPIVKLNRIGADLDCELYESYKICLEFFYPRLTEGGIILLNEYNDPPWPGCKKAVDESLANKPESVEEITRDNYIKYQIIKVKTPDPMLGMR